MLRRQLEGKDFEVRRLQGETSCKSAASSGADPTDRGEKVFCHPEPHWRACTVLDLMFMCLLNITECFYQICVQHQTSRLFLCSVFYFIFPFLLYFFYNSLSCLVSHPDETLRKRLKEKRKGGLCFCSLLHFTIAPISTLVCMNEHETCELCLSTITHRSANP